jgi:catechol 2,3-dioxygenase-like lactoylglutathione lyase family enzyme
MTNKAGSTDVAGPALFMIQVAVDDLAGMVDWYVQTLGLRLVMHDETRGFALLSAGNGKLALKRSTRADRPTRKHVRLVFVVEDVECERARLVARGVVVSEPEENRDEAFREMRLTDPEGTPITLFSWTTSVPSGNLTIP